MTPDLVLDWRAPHETHVAQTIGVLRRGPGDPTFALGADGAVWRTTLTPAGAATVRIVQRAPDLVRVEAWGPGAEAAIAAAPSMLGERDDTTGFRTGVEVLDDAHRRNPGLRVPRTARVMESLVPAILEQKVITLQAHASWRRLVLRFGSAAPGPVPRPMRVVPSASGWRAIPVWEWHRAGVDPKRAATIQRVAAYADRIEEAADLPHAEASARLTYFAGIGAWTAAEVAQRALGDPDAVSVGDYHLAGYVGHALHGRDMNDAEMLEALAPWAGQRYRVIRLIMAAGLRGRPRRGARMAFVDHTAH
ncbi:3-methyladenine DNA glycosylase/8-oxoguanine DNA glycosylase [Agromyces flavus]|uniref:3-methyladenine DNA glycosylase/8-oxoguanine DNA glycosylase n=1 Tax=Agromyces flavus TaxID=589382 RepID=A0ABT1KIQ3_9MICO|nr:DNA-3-methyladenine glycosylase [Agromyces flavus]MCP2366774.1 3-methyladenine DNA glycosylase/8-oxoguanine DNA glycosylase [Agromyces flavus]GGI45343.1 3-methyladenine DNA glycosylase [Agromyces flavus]